MDIFAKRLKELRVSAGISQKKLATALNVSFSIICYWETDRSEPSINNIVKIARFFEVSSDFLLGLRDYE